MVVGDFHKLTNKAKGGMIDPDSSLQLHSREEPHEEPSSSSASTKSATKPIDNEWNRFQAFYKDSGLSKEMVNELYWDHKKMTKPDGRKLSELQRREEYEKQKDDVSFQENQKGLMQHEQKQSSGWSRVEVSQVHGGTWTSIARYDGALGP